jgi:hypothetical protein
MWSFRAYLKAKCADPDFLDQYQEGCTICPNTVMIICAIKEQGLSNEDAARSAGVEPENLDLLETADRCSFEDVQKLGRFLNLPVSNVCRKTNKNSEKP